jgi:hypothetical protein
MTAALSDCIQGYDKKIAGIFGFISVGRFFIAVMLHTVLITIWFLFVGYRLCTLGWDHSDLNLALRGASQAVD